MNDLTRLLKRVDKLEEKQLALEKRIDSLAPPDTWQSLTKAAKYLNVSDDLLRSFIKGALEGKILGLTHGVHFRSMGRPNARYQLWQINVKEFEQYLSLSPNNRN